MMQVRAVFEQSEDWFGVNETRMSNAVKAGLQSAIIYRWAQCMRQHFEFAAYTRYPDVYKQRKGAWVEDKRTRFWKHGHDPRPLRESGNTMNMVMGTARFTSSKTRGEKTITARATFQVPAYLWYMKKWGYDPAAELEATSGPEMGAMTMIITQVVQSNIDEGGGTQKQVQL